MLKAALALAIIFGLSTSHACLQVKPNFSYKLSGNIELQENEKAYTDCVVSDGYASLQNGETFRIQNMVIECNERMLGHNSMFYTLKDGQVSPEESGFGGSYDKHNLAATYTVTDKDGTFTETNILKFSPKCDALNIDVEVKKSGKVNYHGRFIGTLSTKLSRAVEN